MRIPILKIGFFSILLLVAIAFWFYFFNYSYPAVGNGDWLKEYEYINILRYAILSREIPWSIGPHRFLSNPEIIFSVDLFVLPWLSNKLYFFIHTSIYYTLGFLGLILLTKNWSPVPIFFVWILFTFNGFILAHLGAGHLQFIGYFTYPLLFWLLTKLKQDREQRIYVHSVYLAFLLTLLFLNGSLHPAIWACIFLVLVGIFEPILISRIGASIVLAGFLSAFKLIPAATYDTRASSFVTGYPNLLTLIDALTVIGQHDPQKTNIGLLSWFEYDAFIGFVGTALLIFFSIKSFGRQNGLFLKGMFFAGFVMLILSLGNVYELVTLIPKSYFQVERIVTRFISLPLVLFIFCSGFAMNSYWNETSWTNPGKVLLVLLIPLIIFEIYSYIQFYRLPLIRGVIYVPPEFIPQSLITEDNQFRSLFYRYVCVSFAAALFSFWILIRQYRISVARGKIIDSD